MLAFPFCICGNVNTTNPVHTITRYNPRQPVPFVMTAVAVITLGLKAPRSIFFLGQQLRQRRQRPQHSVDARQQIRHRNLGRYTLIIPIPIQHRQQARHLFAGRRPSSTFKRTRFTPAPSNTPPPPPSLVYMNRCSRLIPLF